MMRLHHVNFVGDDMPALDHFYQQVLGIPKMPDPPLIPIKGYSTVTGGKILNPASWLDAGDPAELQVHLCLRDPYLGSRYGMAANPVAQGHVAFRCDDIEHVKHRLDAAGIPYSDYGEWAMKGWYQIFLFDPAGNTVEIHQVL